jgi:hypothetical protein
LALPIGSQTLKLSDPSIAIDFDDKLIWIINPSGFWFYLRCTSSSNLSGWEFNCWFCLQITFLLIYYASPFQMRFFSAKIASCVLQQRLRKFKS